VTFVILQTADAGAFLRFTDTYSKVAGGQLMLAMEPPTPDGSAKEGLLNLRDFSVRGEAALDRAAAAALLVAPRAALPSRRCGLSSPRQNGLLTVREGVVKGPSIGLTIEGNLDFNANQVRMSGTIIPIYGLNNMFGQIPLFGIFLAAAAMRACSA